MDGWKGGRMEAKAGLRIAYSNQKLLLDSINLRLNGGDNNLTKSGKKSCTPLLVEQICDNN